MTANPAKDPVLLAVLKGRLEQIADEMDATLFRSAFNPVIAEGHDACHGIYDGETGDTLIQGKSGLPIFVGVMSFAVRSVIEKAKRRGGLREGDTYIFNDPYEGGTHLSDYKLVRPVFRDGRLVCFLASVGHWLDVGGNVPGNYNPAANECWQEGVVIPPIKLIDAGELRQDTVDVVMANTRLPDTCYGDLNGHLNALDTGEKRIKDLFDEYGVDTVLAALGELRLRAAQLMRSYIKELPNGTYSASDWLDCDGTSDDPIPLHLDLVVADDRITFDFSKSARQCAGPLNIARSTSVAACYVALKHVFRDVPANAGVLEPVNFVIPEESILNARMPRPVGGYTETILRLIDLVFQALAQADPARVNGCAYGTINALSITGIKPDGKRWVMFSFFGGGHGGHPEGDGLNHGNAPISTAEIPPLEILEAAYPILFRQWALRPDSGGAGANRGGLGAIYEIELRDDSASVFLYGDRGKFPPRGVAGGKEAQLNRFVYWDGDGKERNPPMASKMTGLKLEKGQRIRIESPGGGGYGDPALRGPDKIERDIKLGYVTKTAATRDYGRQS